MIAGFLLCFLFLEGCNSLIKLLFPLHLITVGLENMLPNLPVQLQLGDDDGAAAVIRFDCFILFFLHTLKGYSSSMCRFIFTVTMLSSVEFCLELHAAAVASPALCLEDAFGGAMLLAGGARLDVLPLHIKAYLSQWRPDRCAYNHEKNEKYI